MDRCHLLVWREKDTRIVEIRVEGRPKLQGAFPFVFLFSIEESEEISVADFAVIATLRNILNIKKVEFRLRID